MKEQDVSINTVLAELGISQSEQQIYQLGREFGSFSSALMIQRTKMPKPTVMAGLNTLKSFGLCVVQRRDGRSYTYTMQPMSVLKPYFGAKIRAIDGLIDNLDDLSTNEVQTDFETLEADGREKIQELLELALRCKSRKWKIIAPYNNALRYMPKSYTNYFKKVRNERGIQSQTLWEPKLKGKEIKINDVLMRKPRYVPSKVSKDIPAMMIAFDSYLLVVEGKEHPRAVLINSELTARTFEIIFEMAWQSAR